MNDEQRSPDPGQGQVHPELETQPPKTMSPLGEAWSAATPVAPVVRKRRPGGWLWVVALVTSLVVGFLVFQLLRPAGQAEAALAFSFREGDASTYRLHMTMDGEVATSTLGSQSITMDMSETFSWLVKDVDRDGVATIEVSVEDVSGTANGQPVPPTAAEGMTMEIRVAPDGRILSAGGLALSASSALGTGGFPGMGQMTPLLPDHPVAPGDTWTKDFSQSFPFGDGQIHYTTINTFDRYEEVEGVRTAVITSRITVPLDFSLDFGKLLRAFDGGSTQGAKALKDATIDYGGQGSFVMTSWVDPTNGTLVRSSSTGDLEMTMAFSGVPSVPAGSEFSFNGTFGQELQRA